MSDLFLELSQNALKLNFDNVYYNIILELV